MAFFGLHTPFRNARQVPLTLKSWRTLASDTGIQQSPKSGGNHFLLKGRRPELVLVLIEHEINSQAQLGSLIPFIPRFAGMSPKVPILTTWWVFKVLVAISVVSFTAQFR